MWILGSEFPHKIWLPKIPSNMYIFKRVERVKCIQAKKKIIFKVCLQISYM